MITAILTLLSSSAVGSIIGGLFAMLNRKQDLEAKRLDLEHETKRWAHELALQDKHLEIARAEAQGRERVALIEGDATVEAARMGAIAASEAADQVSAEELAQAGRLRWLLVLVSAFRKAIRPTLTVALLGSALYINLLVLQDFVTATDLTPAQQFDLQVQAWSWVMGQASAVLGFWFVSRGTAKG